MPLECGYKQRHGRQFCVTDCPASEPGGFFDYARIERAEDLPASDPRTIDVAVLDLNHGWPNLGHDSIVHAVMDAACDVAPELQAAGLRVRALSFDVRRSRMLPEAPGPRFSLYLGTGGPGHLDPRANDGVRPESQGIHRPLISRAAFSDLTKEGFDIPARLDFDIRFKFQIGNAVCIQADRQDTADMVTGTIQGSKNWLAGFAE